MSIDRKEHWSDYWSRGFLTTLELQSNYDGETAAFWHEQFALLDRNASVLDVCSGNGAVALLAVEYSEKKELGFNVKAMDAAQIDVSSIIKSYPQLHKCIQSIDFQNNVLLEELPVDAESVDLVTSQFGVEYTELEISAKKINRVLKPGGYFSLVSHAIDSEIMQNMSRNLDEFEVLDKIGLFSLELKLGKKEYFRKKFNRELDSILDALHQEAKSSNSEFLAKVGKTLEPLCKLTQDRFRSGVEEFKFRCHSLRFARLRASDLIAVKRLLKASPEWHEAFLNAGLALMGSGEIYQHGNLHIGGYYQFRKPI